MARKGATLSDKTARQEFGLTQDEIYDAIEAGKFQYRQAYMHGNPWVLVVEVNGWQGSRPEALRRVWRGTRPVSMFWNVNGMTRFSYAASGQVLIAFEAMSPDQREGSEPDSWRKPFPASWDTADWVALMLALAARLTGQPVEPAWLDGEFLVMPVDTAAEEVRPDVHPPGCTTWFRRARSRGPGPRAPGAARR